MSASRFSFTRKIVGVGPNTTTEYWNVKATGDWSADNARGREIAVELVEGMAEMEQPQLLGHVMDAIRTKGLHTGIEVGFYAMLAAKLIESHKG